MKLSAHDRTGRRQRWSGPPRRLGVLAALALLPASITVPASAATAAAPPAAAVAAASGKPWVRVLDADVTERDDAVRAVRIRVRLSSKPRRSVRVKFQTSDGTAKAPSDYRARRGSVRFAKGRRTAFIKLRIVGDRLDEADEHFKVRLKGAKRARIRDRVAVVTIKDNDPTPSLTADDPPPTPEGNSGSKVVNFPVRLSAPSGRPVSVSYAVKDGTATRDSDYTGPAYSGLLTFAPGVTRTEVPISILGDTQVEPDETVSLSLSSPRNAVISDGSATAIIRNDDAAPAPTPAPRPDPGPDPDPAPDEGSRGSLDLVGADETEFVPVAADVAFRVTNATLSTDLSDLRVLHNEDDVDLGPDGVEVTGTGITLRGLLEDGRNEIVVLATDTTGRLLSASATLWAASHELDVKVLDADGAPVGGAAVVARLADDSSLARDAVSDVAGLASLGVMPDRTIIVEARGSGNRFGTAAVEGSAASVTVRLKGFASPSAIPNNDFTQGLAGWQVGNAPVRLVEHDEVVGPQGASRARSRAQAAADSRESVHRSAAREQAMGGESLRPQAGASTQATDMDLMLSTSGEGAQSVSRTFTVAPETSSVLVRYRFVTTEVPGGYFGTQYNDYFSVSIRSEGGGGVTADSNSMNGLGLAAFDGGGATAWYEVSLPVNTTGDTVQVDLTVANVADDLLDSHVVVDAVSEPLRIVADRESACPNETVTFRPEGDPEGTINWSGGGAPATGTGQEFATRFATAGEHTVQARLTGATGTRTASRSVEILESSGAAWVARFPTSVATADLVAPFRGNVDRFIAALRAAGATVGISATLRPPERAHLMHYSFRIARENLDPEDVPAMAGVDICWVHRNADGEPDLAASRAAAAAMVAAYQIVHRPALRSRHTEGRAIDMGITWTGDLTVVNGQGNEVTITTAPRTGAGNTDLHAVGGSYAVTKLVGDAPHWSDDGR